MALDQNLQKLYATSVASTAGGSFIKRRCSAPYVSTSSLFFRSASIAAVTIRPKVPASAPCETIPIAVSRFNLLPRYANAPYVAAPPMTEAVKLSNASLRKGPKEKEKSREKKYSPSHACARAPRQ